MNALNFFFLANMNALMIKGLWVLLTSVSGVFFKHFKLVIIF